MAKSLFYKPYLSLLIAICFFTGCERDSPLENEPYQWKPCQTDNPAPFEIKRVDEYPLYYSAAPDPNRSSRFAATGLYNEFHSGGITVFDTQTRSRYQLSGTSLGGIEIDWGENGWILFVGTDMEVHKVNPFDSSIVQLTQGPPCFYPAWNPTGTQFAYMEYDSQYAFVIADSEGNELNRINGVNTRPRWSRDGTKILASEPVGSSQKLFWLAPSGNEERHYFFDTGAGWELYGYDWLPSGDDVVLSMRNSSGDNQLGTVNTLTGSFTLLQSGCSSEKYHWPVSSRNDGWIYYNQTGHYFEESDSSFVIYSRIAKMDPIGNFSQTAIW